MNETIIHLPDETVDYLQVLDYELAGLQVLHTHALNAGTSLEKRMEIRKEFQERFAEYQLAKNAIWEEFAPRFPSAKRWWVDFQTGLLHIETPPAQKENRGRMISAPAGARYGNVPGGGGRTHRCAPVGRAEDGGRTQFAPTGDGESHA